MCNGLLLQILREGRWIFLKITDKQIDEILSQVDYEMDKDFIKKLNQETKDSSNEKHDMFMSFLEVLNGYTREYLYRTITKLKDLD